MFHKQSERFPFNNFQLNAEDVMLKFISPFINVNINAMAEDNCNIGLNINSPSLKNLHAKAFLKQIHHILYSMEGICFDGTDIYVSKCFENENDFLLKLKQKIEKNLHDFCRFIEHDLSVCIRTKQTYNDENRTQIINDSPLLYSGDYFYSCRMCQSLSPYHVCIITPQRAGQCGGIDFQDVVLMYDINKYGPYGRLDKNKLNEYIKEVTDNKIDKINLYSLINNTAPVSPLAQVLAVVLPETNGIVIHDRKYSGKTPTGFTFEEVLNLTKYNVRTEGITGHTRQEIISTDFLKEEDGIKRIAWMPRVTKKLLGVENNFIADEGDATDLSRLLDFIEKNNNQLFCMQAIV